MASDTGGLFRTVDGGSTWNHVNSFIPYTLGAVVYLPANPNIVIATASDDFAVANGGGIWRSTHGGSGWIQIPHPPARHRIHGAIQCGRDIACARHWHDLRSNFFRDFDQRRSGRQQERRQRAVAGLMPWSQRPVPPACPIAMTDSWNLQRFVDAQAPVHDDVIDELRAGRKASHWMWFVFPQLHGLGHSPMAQRYALASLDEARAYLAHPLLGERLRECTRLVLRSGGDDAHAIFGSPDDFKFRSCMTLFHAAAPEEALFAQALEQFFGGRRDARTEAMLWGG